MIVCHKVFSDSTLSRLSKSLEENPQKPRRELAREVCGWLNWVNSKGKPKVSSCMKSFSILNKKGVIVFPEIKKQYTFNKKVVHEKRLTFKPIRCDLADAGEIIIELVKKKNSKSFHIWREIMDDHHYLKNSRLCGCQIKYLIKSSTLGLLGGLSFSSGQYGLAARDRHIEWTKSAQLANLDKIVNNSRFCILPNVKIKNLCSKSLSLAQKRLPDDWFHQYNVRPMLLETFVDGSRYQGTIYKSDNWIYIGKTAGRRDNKPKTIFIKPLKKYWKKELQKEPIYDTFNQPYKDEPKNWAIKEFGRFNSIDKRLRERLYKMAKASFDCPSSALTHSMGSKADYDAACRFFKNRNTSMEMVLAPHLAETVSRIKLEKIVLIPQDTVYLNYTTQAGIREDLGPISTSTDGQIGLLVHDTIAFTTDGTPLGVVDIQCWRRDPEKMGQSATRKKRPIEEKESMKWLNSFACVEKVALECKDTLVVSICDREGDIFEFFDYAKNAKAKIIVRNEQSSNRKIDGCEIIEFLHQREEHKIYEVSFPKRGNKKARTVTVAIRYHKGLVRPPKKCKKKDPVELSVVQILEIGDVPEGENRLEWVLLTTMDVGSFDEALLITKYYTKRWGIEVYHKTMKSGCLIEWRQTEGIESLKTSIALDMIVAYRILYMTMVSRTKPEALCTEIFTEPEWQTIHLLKTKKIPTITPTLQATVILLAMLGGYLNRKKDPPPGIKVIWRGFQSIRLAVEMYKMQNPNAPP